MRYSKYQVGTDGVRRETNPVWRGIGCILFFLTPPTALAIAIEIMNSGIVQRWIDLPRGMLRPLTLPGVDFTIPFFQASLVLTLAITVMLYALYFTIYAAMWRLIGPSPYGPTDVPPIRAKRKIRKSR